MVDRAFESFESLALTDHAVLAKVRTKMGAAFAAELLGDFRAVAVTVRGDLAIAWQQGDIETVRGLSHKIKGAARYLGFPRLSALCEAVEEAAAAGERTEVDRLMPGFEPVLEATLAAAGT